MVIYLKRKVQTELLTTYLPTLLLLSISYATTFFKPEYFEASLTVNLTIMLVMTTIFTTKISELPPTSDMKMLDAWLIFCLFIPFAFSLIQTAIESYRDAIDDTGPKRAAWTEPLEDDQKVLFFLKLNFSTSFGSKSRLHRSSISLPQTFYPNPANIFTQIYPQYP